MLKKRFGEDFATKLSGNLEVKLTQVVKKDVRGGRQRKPRGDRGERKPREPREPK